MRFRPFLYRCTLFAKQAIEISQAQSYAINDKLHSLGLFVYPRSGTIFTIGPNGAESINITAFEFSDSTKSLVITYDQNRVDIIYTERTNNRKTLRQFVDEVKIIMDAFQEISLDIQRCALATSQLVEEIEKNNVYGKLVKDEDTNPFEWNVRKVTKAKVEGFPLKPINFVTTVSRNIRKIPSFPNLIDAVCLETDFNTDATSVNVLSFADMQIFFNLMVEKTDEAVNTYKNRLN